MSGHMHSNVQKDTIWTQPKYHRYSQSKNMALSNLKLTALALNQQQPATSAGWWQNADLAEYLGKT